jgi:hypothetical protein
MPVPAGLMMATGYSFTVTPPKPLLTTEPDLVLSTHDSLQRLLRKAKRAPNQGAHVAYDLSKCTDIDPGAVLLMMYAGQKLAENGWGAYATGESAAMRKLSKNLEHLRLLPENRATFVRDAGEYPLRSVDNRNTMVRELEEWALTVRQGTQAKPEDVAIWGMQISEVVTNGFQHGPTNLGHELPAILLAGGVNDAANRVQLAALDFGSGIPRVIEGFVSEAVRLKGDGALIREACKKGVTSHCSRQNQGYGLPHLIESVKQNGGTLQIFSHRGFVHVTANGRTYARNYESSDRRLDGTLTIVSLRVENGRS